MVLENIFDKDFPILVKGVPTGEPTETHNKIQYLLEHICFCVICQLEGSSGLQNTPTVCGNNFHTRATQL